MDSFDKGVVLCVTLLASAFCIWIGIWLGTDAYITATAMNKGYEQAVVKRWNRDIILWVKRDQPVQELEEKE